DGDSDIDIISASRDNNRIAWYENLDGIGTFGNQNIVPGYASEINAVYATDIDGDGDIDILSASRTDTTIGWNENLDGLGNYGSRQRIARDTDVDFGKDIFAADIDGDGDMDVLSASRDDNKIAWFENLDGIGNFGIPNVISTNTHWAMSVYSSDIDGDGDMDVL